MKIIRIISIVKKNPCYGTCSVCGRKDDDGGPLCGNVFCPGGN